MTFIPGGGPISDPGMNQTKVHVSHFGALKAAPTYPVLKSNFPNTQLNTDIWHDRCINEAVILVHKGVGELHSGTDPYGDCKIVSKEQGIFEAGQVTVYQSGVYAGKGKKDAGKRWGMVTEDETNALYFEWASHTFYQILYTNTSSTNNSMILDETLRHNISNIYDDYCVFFYSGLGEGQIKLINSYNEINNEVIFKNNFKVAVDETSKYFLLGHIKEATDTTAKLSKAESDVDNFLNNTYIYIYDGPGKGQTRRIKSYDGTNKIITVDKWNINPTSRSRYFLRGRILSASINTAILNLTLGNITNKCIILTNGSGAGQERKINSFNSQSKEITIDNWDTIPDSVVFQVTARNNGFETSVSNDNFNGEKNWEPLEKNNTFRIHYSTGRAIFQRANNGNTKMLHTMVNGNFPLVSNLDMGMLYQCYNAGNTDDIIMRLRGASSSIFGELPTTRPGETFTEKTVTRLNTAIIVGETKDKKFIPVAINSEGEMITCNKLDLGEKKHIFGRNYDVDNDETPESIWQFGSLNSFLTSSTILQVKSTENDDNISGNGARTIKIEGLNSDYEEIEETINMNGTTVVPTTNQYLRVNDAYILTAGSKGYNDGIIYIEKSGGPFLVKMNKKTNSALNAIYTVPKNKTCYIKRLHVSSYLKNKKKEISEGSTTLKVREFNQVFRPRYLTGLDNDISFDIPIKINEKSDIYLEVDVVNNNNFIVSGGFNIILI